ncbi:unnamed protein product [Amaranthus hypochondriacus]
MKLHNAANYSSSAQVFGLQWCAFSYSPQHYKRLKLIREQRAEAAKKREEEKDGSPVHSGHLLPVELSACFAAWRIDKEQTPEEALEILVVV